jgi:hypothetical protein
VRRRVANVDEAVRVLNSETNGSTFKGGDLQSPKSRFAAFVTGIAENRIMFSGSSAMLPRAECARLRMSSHKLEKSLEVPTIIGHGRPVAKNV